MSKITDFSVYPDAHGRFGNYGGSYVAETLMAPLAELTEAYLRLRQDPEFLAELDRDLKYYVGRPSPIYHARAAVAARRRRAHPAQARRPQPHRRAQDQQHHRSGAGRQAHGQARASSPRPAPASTASRAPPSAARFGLECVVYMGAVDIERQKINVYRMKLLGAEVVPVTSGSKTLKDALNEAMRDWVTNVADTFYIIGTVAGPHPYPMMVRDFNAVVGREAREQMLEQFGRLPDALGRLRRRRFERDRPVPCVPQRSPMYAIVGAEAAGEGIATGHHAASLAAGRPGVLHGNRTYVLCDDNGQITETHSISAGLDYPGVGPEHAFLKDVGRARICRRHRRRGARGVPFAGAYRGHPGRARIQPRRRAGDQAGARACRRTSWSWCNLSGRGDKDVHTIAAREGVQV